MLRQGNIHDVDSTVQYANYLQKVLGDTCSLNAAWDDGFSVLEAPVTDEAEMSLHPI